MEIRRYLTLIQRWAWLIILGAVLAGVTAYIISINTAPVYRASARLLIDEAPGGTSGNEYSQVLFEQRLTATYVELLQLRPVLEETVEQLELPFDAGRLNSKLSVSAPAESQIIVVSVEDTIPERAALIANTIGEVFMRQNEQRQSARFQESISNWEERRTEIGAEINALETQINELGEPETPEEEANLSQLQTNLREAEIRYTEAFNNLEELRVEEAKGSNNLILVEPASAPSRDNPIRPRTVTNTLLATVVGAMLALGIVFLIEYLDDTVKSPEQLQQAAGISTLGAIATIKGDEMSDRLITQNAPRAPISEAYRVLRTNLNFSAVDEELSTILITSASPGEGKSTTTANLAIVIAQTGKRVIIVDSDLRRPVQHKIFERSNNQGLTTALLDAETPVRHHLQETQTEGLRVLTSGPIPPNPAELLNSQRMSTVLETLQEEADFVLLDSPPTLTVADATILAPQVKGCMLVTKVASTRLQAVLQAAESLQKTGAHLLGAVLNQVHLSRSGYYNYYQYYQYEYTREPAKREGVFRLPGWLSGLGNR